MLQWSVFLVCRERLGSIVCSQCWINATPCPPPRPKHNQLIIVQTKFRSSLRRLTHPNWELSIGYVKVEPWKWAATVFSLNLQPSELYRFATLPVKWASLRQRNEKPLKDDPMIYGSSMAILMCVIVKPNIRMFPCSSHSGLTSLRKTARWCSLAKVAIIFVRVDQY